MSPSPEAMPSSAPRPSAAVSAVGHYENFPVASWLLPVRIRPAVAAIYWFARSADDLADEGELAPEERLRALADYRRALERLRAGQVPADPRWRGLGEAITRHRLSWQPFHDLLAAFEQDVRRNRYDDDASLRDYCRRSAEPVGRLMLELFDRREPALLEASDAICTALQLINFLQDMAIDWSRGRLYLPLEDLRACGGDPSLLEQASADGQAPPALRCASARLHARAAALMQRGHGLPRALGGRAGLEIAATIAGGERILERLARGGHDAFANRPTLAVGDWLIIGARALALRFR